MSCLCEKLKPKGSEWSQICIGQLWVFDGLRQAEVEAVVREALRQKYQAGQSVFMQGDTAKQISLIKAGRVKLSKLLEDGTELTLDIRKPGDFLGEYIFNDPNIGLQVIKNLSGRIAQLTDRVGAMSQTHLEERLYSVLLNVAREHGEKKEEGYVIQFPLTHEDLGFLIGAHRVSITRVMKRLKDSGKILQAGRKLVLPLEAVT